MTSYETLISAEALQALLPNARLIDCRARLDDVSWGPKAHAEGHLPGAVHADLATHLADPPGRRGRHPLPERQRLLDQCRSWGLKDSDQIVCYDNAGGAMAARAWWLLRWLGHSRVAVLDGGMATWQGALERGIPTTAAGTFSDRPPLTRTASVEDALSPGPATLVDARAQARYDGAVEPIDHTAGHIPGAVCLPFEGNLDANGRFLPAPELRARFGGISQSCICYCGSGVTAAHNILSMRVAGLPEAALYPGSWSEWIEDPTRPVETA